MEKEEETHYKVLLKRMAIYADIRADYGDLEDLEGLVGFYTRVLERRDLVDLGEEQEEDLTLAVGSTADVRQREAEPSLSS